MTAWCHLPTIFNQRRALPIVGLLLLFVALTTTLIFSHTSLAAPGTNKTINFQGRLNYPTGGVVADGYYNIQFKIYQDGTGSAANNPGGTLKWTESYTNNGGTAGIQVKGGYFTVNLGSKTPFGESVDWDQDTLWLSMNIAGTAVACTSFGTNPCAADGEMLPMQRMTAVPYALNAGALGGKAAENFIQMAQGVQTDASSNTSSVFVNRTGFNGNFLQLQNSGVDMFTLNDQGDIVMGSAVDHEIKVATSAADTDGRYLALIAGNGGSGTGTNGGNLLLQGGAAGGTNGDGGDIGIDAGQHTGSGSDGIIAIGTTYASNILIGSTYRDVTQNILVGANDTAGNNTSVIIGAGGAANSGSTTIRAKETIRLETNGTTRATFAEDANAVYFGNGVTASAPSDFTIQGTNSTANGAAGGSLTVQGGNATTGNAHGGDVILAGGSGIGAGTDGLVVLSTPTFATVTNDANCRAGGSDSATSCAVTQHSIDSSSAVVVGFSANGQTATIPNPTRTTPGRIVYVMASSTSTDFTLNANAGALTLTLKKNAATSLIWNGSAWASVGGTSGNTLQSTYDNSPQGATSDIVLNNTTSTGGLAIKDSATDPINNTMLTVSSASNNSIFSVNSAATNEHATNPGAETAGGSASTFPANTWASIGSASASRYTTAGSFIASGAASIKVDTTGALSGVSNRLASALLPNKTYTVSMKVRTASGVFTDFGVSYSADGTNLAVDCALDVTIEAGAWRQVSCSFQTPASSISAQNFIAIGQSSAATRTFYIDDLSISQSDGASSSVKIGNGSNTGNATLFTLDKSPTAPTAPSSDALLGSMYYDTTIGKVQCYEADGWGTCSAQPDTFVTLSPEYTNAVVNTSGTGTLTTDLCSDTLNINDGSSAQPTICGTNETYNFYKWTTPQVGTQTRSMYVTYQLPATFKGFVPNATSLMARTTSADADAKFTIYRNRTGTGLTTCGSTIAASTGAQTTWQKSTAATGNDPANCAFVPGDSILVKIDLSSKNNAITYISNLNFAFSNN